MQRLLLSIVVTAATVISQTSSVSAGSLKVVNDVNAPITVWFKAPAQNWIAVPVPVAGRKNVSFESPGPTFVVIRSNGQDFRLGWRDLYQASQRYPNAELRFEAKTTQEERTQTYTVTSPVWEIRTREVIRYWWIWHCGRWVVMPVRTFENYKVCKMVPEKRSKTYIVTKFEDFDMGVGRNGMFEPVRDATGDVRLAIIEDRLRHVLPDDIRALVGQPKLNEAECARVNEYLSRAGLFCDVTFKTATPGADVYAQLRSEQLSKPVGRSEVFVKQFPSGLYWVWAVRNGTQTKRQLEDIITDPQVVYIPEE